MPRTRRFCTDDCYPECRCLRWPDYVNRWGDYVRPHPEDEEEEDWWLAGGITAANCLAAYTPIGAGSLAASYDNNAAPDNGLADGTYDCTLGVAPGLAADGWTFDGATQYLNTGLPGSTKPLTMIARANMTDILAHRTFVGQGAVIASYQWRVHSAIFVPQLQNAGLGNIGVAATAAPAGSSHVYAVSYSGVGAYQFYLDGIPDGNGVNDMAMQACDLWIGAVAPAASECWLGSIQAMAFYDTVLTDAQVLAVSTAAAAL